MVLLDSPVCMSSPASALYKTAMVTTTHSCAAFTLSIVSCDRGFEIYFYIVAIKEIFLFRPYLIKGHGNSYLGILVLVVLKLAKWGIYIISVVKFVKTTIN